MAVSKTYRWSWLFVNGFWNFCEGSFNHFGLLGLFRNGFGVRLGFPVEVAVVDNAHYEFLQFPIGTAGHFFVATFQQMLKVCCCVRNRFLRNQITSIIDNCDYNIRLRRFTMKLPGRFCLSMDTNRKNVSSFRISASFNWGAPRKPFRKSSRAALQHRQLKTSCNQSNSLKVK